MWFVASEPTRPRRDGEVVVVVVVGFFAGAAVGRECRHRRRREECRIGCVGRMQLRLSNPLTPRQARRLWAEMLRVIPARVVSRGSWAHRDRRSVRTATLPCNSLSLSVLS